MNSENNKLKLLNWFFRMPKTTGFLVFLLLTSILGINRYQQYQIVKNEEQSDIRNALFIVDQNIVQSVKNATNTALILALTIDNDGVPTNFDSVGKKLLNLNQSLSAVRLAPKGVIRYVYPIQGNEELLGFNILKSASNKKEALDAIKSQKIYFTGPIDSKQGGSGIIGRLPISKNDKFCGFSTVIIKLENLLDSSGTTSIDRSKYQLQLSKIAPNFKQKKTYYLPEENKSSKNESISLLILDGDWKITLTSKNLNYLNTQIVLSTIFGLLLAGLFGFQITQILKKPAKLQLLVQEQTAKLLDGEIKYRRIFDEAAIGIAYSDPNDNYFLEANKKYCELLGYSASELKEMTFESLTHPDDLQKDLSSLKEITQGRITKYSMEKRYITKFGTTIWVNLTISPLFDSDKKVSKVIALVEDITSKKESEALIKKSESHFKSLFKDSPLPLCEQDFSEVKLHLLEHHLMNEKKEIVTAYLLDNPKFIQKLESLIKIVRVNKACLKLYKVKKNYLILNMNYQTRVLRAIL